MQIKKKFSEAKIMCKRKRANLIFEIPAMCFTSIKRIYEGEKLSIFFQKNLF